MQLLYARTRQKSSVLPVSHQDPCQHVPSLSPLLLQDKHQVCALLSHWSMLQESYHALVDPIHVVIQVYCYSNRMDDDLQFLEYAAYEMDPHHALD